MKLQIGSSNVRLEGFLNVDIQPAPNVDIVTHAGDLRCIPDASVTALFSHAVFEHLFIGHHLAVLQEWKRTLAPDVVIVCLGIPDFAKIAALYLQQKRAPSAEPFDLYQVYRYTHGDPEQLASSGWADWHPGKQPNAAPPRWLPQLHKGLFDAEYLHALLRQAELTATLFHYSYPSEEPPFNLGFVATKNADAIYSKIEPLRSVLETIPAIERFVRRNTLTLWRNRKDTPLSGMLRHIQRLG